MKLRLHIERVAIEADWPRSGHADFAAALQDVLAAELADAARGGTVATHLAQDRPTRRLGLRVPAAALASPAGAGARVGREIAGVLTPAGAKPGPGSRS